MTELTCSANTLRHANLTTRARASAGAGFTGIGLRLDDYRDGGLTDTALHDLLVEHGLRIVELEHNWDWAAESDTPEENLMFHLADAVGYRQLNVSMFAEHSPAELIDGFGRLCDRAAAHGVLVGLEFIPYSHLRTLDAAWKIVTAADRSNGGVIVDCWHWFRSGATPADLAGVPADAITGVQLCDVLATPLAEMTTEARHHRLLPGRGTGDTNALLAALRGHGVTAPVSVEVFSDAQDALPADVAAREAFTATTEVLTAGGWPPGQGKESQR